MTYSAEPADAAAMVAHLAEFDDPAELYARASAEYALLRTAAERATEYKARALAALWRSGMSYARIAELPWVEETRSGVQKLVERGRDAIADSGPAGDG
jgi:hypothetical protein